MRAAPEFQILLRRFGVWRAGVVGLAGFGVSTLAAWVLDRERPIDPAVLSASVVLGIALVVLAASLLRVPAVSLRWDGLAWHLGPVDPAAGDVIAGDLAVVIDLGAWMLLRFAPAASGSCQRRIWLPVQRQGIEAHWHALRCSVYSPHAFPGTDAATGG